MVDTLLKKDAESAAWRGLSNANASSMATSVAGASSVEFPTGETRHVVLNDLNNGVVDPTTYSGDKYHPRRVVCLANLYGFIRNTHYLAHITFTKGHELDRHFCIHKCPVIVWPRR